MRNESLKQKLWVGANQYSQLNYSLNAQVVALSLSDPEFGVLDAVLAVASFDNAVDVGVELADLFDLGLNTFAGGSVVPEVLGFAEEVFAETFVGVDEDAVLVAV